MNLPAISRWRSGLFRLPRFSGGPGEITLAGTIVNSQGTGGSGMRVYGQWALVYCVSGRCFYKDERGTSAEVRAGSWILVFPEMGQAYGPAPGESWNEIYVCFRGPVFEAWREAGCFDPLRPTGHWSVPTTQGVRAFQKFFSEIQRKTCTSLKAACLWQGLLAQILGAPKGTGIQGEGWLKQALDFLEHSELEGGTATLHEAAQACGMGYESFRKKFESAIGMPPGRYVLVRRTERARRLLAIPSLTNSEIAGMLGFYDEYHFSKTFSRLTGISPRDFRKQARRG